MSMRVRAGMVIASSTPATVACTPESKKASQSADAEDQVRPRLAHAQAVEHRHGRQEQRGRPPARSQEISAV